MAGWGWLKRKQMREKDKGRERRAGAGWRQEGDGEREGGGEGGRDRGESDTETDRKEERRGDEIRKDGGKMRGGRGYMSRLNHGSPFSCHSLEMKGIPYTLPQVCVCVSVC